MSDRYFILPNGKGLLHFTGSVIEHMYTYAQIKDSDKEAGGQLFSQNPDESKVLISLATGPYDEDTRSRNQFNPCLRKVNQDRKSLFKRGLFAVGLWHTHPEPNPKPSHEDKATTFKYLNACEKEMSGFIQTIVGNSEVAESLSVWLAYFDTKSRWMKLSEV